jgi:hypothetical protein
MRSLAPRVEACEPRLGMESYLLNWDNRGAKRSSGPKVSLSAPLKPDKSGNLDICDSDAVAFGRTPDGCNGRQGHKLDQ